MKNLTITWVTLAILIGWFSDTFAGDREKKIFLSCRASTGGEPVTLFGCIGERLATQELVNFINGEAFGPNNEFVKLWKSITGNKPYNNYLVATMPYRGGVIFVYRSGSYWSPDGKNPRGGGNTIRVYDGNTPFIAMLPYRGGVITAFKNSGVYFSPNGMNIGGGGNTRNIYGGSGEVRKMELYRHSRGLGVKTLFSNGIWYCSPDGNYVGGGGNTHHC